MNKTLILLSISVILIVLYGQIDFTTLPFENWDLAAYRSIASSSPRLAVDVTKPFAYRLLGPYIVGLIPIPDALGFYIFSMLSSIALVALFYIFLLNMGISSNNAFISIVIFMCNKYWFGFNIWDFFQINDILSLIFIMIMFWAIEKDKWAIFGGALFLGAFTRETSMIMIPTAFVYLSETKSIFAKWRKALYAIIPGLAAFFIIRLVIPTGGGLSLTKALITYSSKLLSPEAIPRLILNTFMPFSFIPFIYYETSLKFFKTKKYYLVFFILVFFSALFGSNNERLMSPVFIVVYPLIATIIQEQNFSTSLKALIVSCALLSSFHHVYGLYPLPSIKLTYLFSFGSLLIISTMALIYRLTGLSWHEKKI